MIRNRKSNFRLQETPTTKLKIYLPLGLRSGTVDRPMGESPTNGLELLRSDGVYVERDCVVEHGGRRFEAGGAVVTPQRIIAYLGRNEELHDWHGRQLGTYRVTASWRIHSYMSDTMCQVEALVNGVAYKGRSGGVGLVYRGRRKRAPSASR